MKRASFAWRCLVFAVLVCGWVVLAHSQSKKLWQVYAEAGETAFQEGRRPTAEMMLLSAIKEAESEAMQDRWLGKINYELAQLYSDTGYQNQGKAEGYFLAAIGIFEKLKESSDVAHAVIDLSLTYQAQDKYSEAEKCVKEGLEFVEQSKKADDKTMASLVDMLAMIQLAQNRIEEAEAVYSRLQAVGEAGKLYPKTLEDEAQGRATWFLYRAKRYPEAERLLKGELALLKKQSALTTLAAADALNDLADVHCRQRKFQEAETEKKQSIEIKTNLIAKKLLDPDTNPTDWALADLALIQYTEGNGAQAESLFQESLNSMKQRREKKKDDKDRKALSFEIANRLEQFAELYSREDKNEKSASCYKEAVQIRESEFGQHDAGTVATGKEYIKVLRTLKRDAEAREVEAHLEPAPK